MNHGKELFGKAIRQPVWTSPRATARWKLMKQYVSRTMNQHCIGGLGGFGGLFELDCTGIDHPVLISGTDGVGTKLRIAMLLDKHDTVGIDCVAMCVNDVICAGAKPLVFLDYIACGKNVPEKIADLVKGVAEGCVQRALPWWAARRPRCPAFTPRTSTTWRASPWAWWIRARSWTTIPCSRGM